MRIPILMEIAERKAVTKKHSAVSFRTIFTFDSYLAIRPGANGVVCSANVGSLLRNILVFEIRLLVANFGVEDPLGFGFVCGSEVPLVFIIIRVAIGHANQQVFAVFLALSDCAIGGVWYKLIKN
jgi:hypothetical protein